ncbi:MAG: hypothetical protein ABMB14_21285 [Myxococcota bacterium]
MVRALGFSENPFDPRDPGRLCRGRERWIEPWELDAPVPLVHRIVVSGAAFSDDGAGDARRGLSYSGIDLTSIVHALYPDAPWLAFMEDGHPADIPPEAHGVEAYEGYRAGGRQELGLVRWWLPITDHEQLRVVLDDGPAEDRIRGLVVLDPDADTDADALMARVFDLVGFSTLDSPPARYQPSALPEVLELAQAVVLLHRDKHGPAVAVYARDPVADLRTRLEGVVGDGDTLVVPFAIPPMLARWDRALAELRSEWPTRARAAGRSGAFPVPPAPAPAFAEGRRRRWPRDEEEVGAADLGPQDDLLTADDALEE